MKEIDKLRKQSIDVELVVQRKIGDEKKRWEEIQTDREKSLQIKLNKKEMENDGLSKSLITQHQKVDEVKREKDETIEELKINY